MIPIRTQVDLKLALNNIHNITSIFPTGGYAEYKKRYFYLLRPLLAILGKKINGILNIDSLLAYHLQYTEGCHSKPNTTRSKFSPIFPAYWMEWS